MKQTKTYGWTSILAAMLLMFASCSTQKNTWASRSYHQTKVKYNIYYNGNIAYEEGLVAIGKAAEDDYSQILNLYPVSDHKAAESAASQMDKTIEKCRKCIKLHSIKSKPSKIDPKKRNDPAYKLWLQSEEFNKEMGNAWLRLGEAEFHKGDFLGSIGTFNYISKHYQNDADMIARCGLWTARAYAEMGWLYEAEDVLSKVQIDALSRKHAPLYSAVSADVMLKAGHYHEAIPFLKIALPHEKRKIYRPRFQYVLAQLYEREGNRQAAADSYKKVSRMTPGPELDFHASLRRAELEGKSSIKSLKRMAKQSKYKDKMDIIYGTIGNIYLAAGDTASALQNYETAIEKSTQAGLDKAAILVTAGDLYYNRHQYVEAQPMYREATTIIPAENADYPRLRRCSETLDELIVEMNAVQLQDSLQRLSKMTEEEQRSVISKLIEDLIKAEKEAEEQALLAEREAQQGGPQSVNTSNMIGGGGASADWYFYNPSLIRSGKQDFSRKWGTRTLEDNWRRLSKSASPIFTENTSNDDEEGQSADSLRTDSTLTIAPETDTHKPEYYLQQIPKTEADIAASDSIIARALNNMVYIYQEKLEDIAQADATLEELMRRFPGHEYLLELYYMKYLEALKHEDSEGELKYRNLILNEFADSKQAYIVSQPDYFDRLRRMAVEQDSLYESTYKAFTSGNYSQVKAGKQHAEANYPLSPLMPRFVFLNAIAVAKTNGQDAFIQELQLMVNNYPESELGAMAKDFLAMMGQGMESQKGGSTSNLSDLRGQAQEEEKQEEEMEKQFSTERKGASYVLILLASSDEQDLNSMLYQTALFNFSQFLIRDFELQKLPVYGDGSAIRIGGLDSVDEALWYIGLIKQNNDLMSEVNRHEAKLIPITEENYQLLNTRFTVAEYLEFMNL